MKIISGSKRRHYVTRVIILLAAIALIVWLVSWLSAPSSENLEIRTWYDLDAITDNLAGNHILMNDLDSTTAGYEELAGPTANQGKGWEPIGFFGAIGGGGCSYGVAPWWYGLTGTFDGQRYEIRDLFINRPDECHVSPMGLFGSIDEGGIIKNVGVVNVTVIGCESVGGLVGYNRGTVSNSYSSGNVTGNEHVGGLVGRNRESTVSNSYSTSNVTGTSYVGGLVGYSDGTVSNSYATGSVAGEHRVGGLVGWDHKGTVSNSFWDTETSGQSTSAGGTGKNTTEMHDIATFSGAGWHIIAVADPCTRNLAYIWNIVDAVTYPFLSWQP